MATEARSRMGPSISDSEVRIRIGVPDSYRVGDLIHRKHNEFFLKIFQKIFAKILQRISRVLDFLQQMPLEIVMAERFSERDRLFCEYVAAGMTEQQAARKLGRSGSRSALKHLMSRPVVRDYMAQLHEEARKRFQITRDDVIAGMQEAIADAKLQADPNAQIAGWREIGRILGLYAPDKTELKLTLEQQTHKDKLQGLSDEQLLELVDLSNDVIEGEYEHVEH